MKFLKKITFYKLLLIFGILLFLSISVYFFYKFLSKEVKQSEDQTVDVEYVSDMRDCVQDSRSALIGEWKYPGGEITPIPRLVLEEDAEFTLYDWAEEEYIIEGRWELVDDGVALKLIFDELDKYWTDLLEDDPQEYFDGVVEYDIEKKEIAFRVGYFERMEDFTGECKQDRFYIDLFNVYLYKTTD